MNIGLSLSLRAQAFFSHTPSVFDGGTWKLYTLSAANNAGDLLGTGTIPSPAFSPLDGNDRNKSGTWVLTALLNGTAAGILIESQDGDFKAWLTVTQSGSGGDVIIDHSAITIGNTITLTALTWDAFLFSANFEDGTTDPFTPSGTGVSVVADPTGERGGKVCKMHFAPPAGQSADRNIGVAGQIFTFGESRFFRGYLYLNSYNDTRKLIRFDSNTGSNNTWVILWVAADGLLKIEGYAGGVLNVFSAFTSIPNGQWLRLEKQITINSAVGVADGIYRVWINDVLVYENTAIEIFDDLLHNFDTWRVGEQASAPAMGEMTEDRYWDNVAFATTRIGA